MPPLRPVHLTLGVALRVAGTILLIGFIVAYVLFQARNFIEGPQVALSDTGGTVHTSRTIALSGNAENITILTLNGREIHTNEAGDFEETLVLENGYTIMTLHAQDRFGRSTSLTREFVYLPVAQTGTST